MSDPQSVACEMLTLPELERDQEFWNIYHESFPPEETESESVIYRSMVLGGKAFRAQINGRTVAMATTQDLRNPHTLFLIYLAVDPSCRGQSLGSVLLEWIWDHAVQSDPSMQGMVWEVDRVEDARDDVGKATREKRLRFFGHHGGNILSYAYQQPALDGVKPVSMHLLFRSTSDRVPTGLEFTRAIYFDKYQQVNGVSQKHLNDLLEGRDPPSPAYPK